MNTGSLSSLVQQIEGGQNWWNMSNIRMQPYEQSSLLPTSSPSSSLSSSSSSSSLVLAQYPAASHLVPTNTWHENQDLPESWRQLLMEGLVGEDERCCYSTPFQAKQMDNSETHQFVYPSVSLHLGDVKPDISQFPPAASTISCITTNLNNNILDFSHNKQESNHNQQDYSSECNNTTGSAFKKARVQASQTLPTFKVRKEKLGDRITALHQIVSPFGKTDTASVLLEAIGYIRFLQAQIEALSMPYLGGGSNANMSQALFNDGSIKKGGALEQDVKDEPKRDLRSRGLCLVPVSCTMRAGSHNGDDYQAPTFGGGFR